MSTIFTFSHQMTFPIARSTPMKNYSLENNLMKYYKIYKVLFFIKHLLWAQHPLPLTHPYHYLDLYIIHSTSQDSSLLSHSLTSTLATTTTPFNTSENPLEIPDFAHIVPMTLHILLISLLSPSSLIISSDFNFTKPSLLKPNSEQELKDDGQVDTKTDTEGEWKEGGKRKRENGVIEDW